jgi:arginyl-tRNA synthetase
VAPSFDVSKIHVEITREKEHGEISTNIALVLAKTMHTSPKDLAKTFLPALGSWPEIHHIEIAAAGFINMTLRELVWERELKNIVKKGKEYAEQPFKNENIHVEFVSANPTGPMHTGHVRNAVFGDVLAALLQKIGYNVHKEYYVNDAGSQVDCLARSVFLRYQEALGVALPAQAFQGDVYPGNYLIPVGHALAKQEGARWLNQPENYWLPFFKDFSIHAMMTLIQDNLQELGIIMDEYTSEKSIVERGKLDEALAILKTNDDIYTGILTQPKGKKGEDWEERPQTLFRATKYGDESDRPLKKSDGSWTYFASDIAYHLDKYQRGFSRLINVLGADHCGYVTRLKAATQAVTQGKAHLEIKLFQIVNFFEKGEPVKMSKRSGHFITSHEVVDRVGKEATRFMMISKHHGTTIDFDFQKVLEMSLDNPLFYIQYAHARICSVFRYATSVFPHLTETFVKQNVDSAVLALNPTEISVVKWLASWPKTVEQAAIHCEPHRLAHYLYGLAGEFHGLWNQGKSDLALRFVDVNQELTTFAKLVLLSGVAVILRDGLELLGIQPIQEMR